MSFHFFQILKSPTKELLEILNNNIIGTPGHGMLYQHLGVSNKIGKISDPYFVNLVRKENIIGTGCFCNRLTMNNGKVIPAFYIRYFSFKEKYRRATTTERKKKKTEGRLLRKEINQLLTGRELGIDVQKKFFHYAYVDPRNSRSLLLCNEFGFEKIREFSTIIFNRLCPRKFKNIEVIEGHLEETIKELLKEYYADYNMFSFENLFVGRRYYVVRVAGEIVAGVSVNPEHWKIHSLPGILGQLLLNCFSALPFFNRIINKDYRFLTLEGIYCKEGHEKSLEILIESLLAQHKLNSAMIWADIESNLYKTMKMLNLGLVSKLNKEVKASVLCKFIHFDEKEIKIFKDNPAYISGIDLT